MTALLFDHVLWDALDQPAAAFLPVGISASRAVRSGRGSDSVGDGGCGGGDDGDLDHSEWWPDASPATGLDADLTFGSIDDACAVLEIEKAADDLLRGSTGDPSTEEEDEDDEDDDEEEKEEDEDEDEEKDGDDSGSAGDSSTTTMITAAPATSSTTGATMLTINDTDIDGANFGVVVTGSTTTATSTSGVRGYASLFSDSRHAGSCRAAAAAAGGGGAAAAGATAGGSAKGLRHVLQRLPIN